MPQPTNNITPSNTIPVSGEGKGKEGVGEEGLNQIGNLSQWLALQEGRNKCKMLAAGVTCGKPCKSCEIEISGKRPVQGGVPGVTSWYLRRASVYCRSCVDGALLREKAKDSEAPLMIGGPMDEFLDKTAPTEDNVEERNRKERLRFDEFMGSKSGCFDL